MALPWVSTINPPNIAKVKIIGNNQNFFLTLKNRHNSYTNSIKTSLFDRVNNWLVYSFFKIDHKNYFDE